MVWVKRIFLFMAVNLLVMLTVSLLLKVFNVQPYLTAKGLNYESLAAFCLIWGMGGAFISLALSRIMAKWMMGVEVIDPATQNASMRNLVQRVYFLAQKAGLKTMPQVGIYNSPDINAFATGPSKSRSLVAVSTGLLERMDRNEAEGVLAHEIAHIANGDMVTMTLIQGVVNAFAMFLARALAFAISQMTSGNRDSEEGSSGGMSSLTYFITQFVLEIIFMILGSIVVAWFSRWREFRADAGGAKLAGKAQMIAALQALQRNTEMLDSGAGQGSVQTLKISSKGSGLYRFFSTHPDLAVRIQRLQESAS